MRLTSMEQSIEFDAVEMELIEVSTTVYDWNADTREFDHRLNERLGKGLFERAFTTGHDLAQNLGAELCR